MAEIASAFLCADLGITPEVREDHASYITEWLQVLKNNKRAVFTAASQAQKAVEFLHGLQKAVEFLHGLQCFNGLQPIMSR